MQLTPGRTLGPYEIIDRIGAGGMGAVYRARDTRLNRPVAIKVLSEELTANPKLRDRLTREARSISSLSHPNICALYDVGSEDGTDYLVMEFLEGETLAHRLEHGSLPLRQALRIAADLAGALDAAHRAGVIHRDLKPANVILTRSGAKLVDFGLAKQVEPETDPHASTMHALTEPGTVVGTLHYMSPEQIGGLPLDSRSDIFSFGAMLYEMLSGRRPFNGSSRMSVISSILNDHPQDVGDGPEPLKRLVRKCLEKNPEDRWQSAADLRDELQWIASGDAAAQPAQQRPVWPWIAAAAAVLALIGAAYFVRQRPAVTPSHQVRFGINPPADGWFGQRAVVGELAVSPDGTYITVASVRGGRRLLLLRKLDDLTPREIAGTEGARSPFWSPDGKWIGFFSNGKLKKVVALGGPVQTICAGNGGSGTWSRSGQIIFSEWGADEATAYLKTVGENGGTPVEVRDPTSKRWHFWPSFLPDGEHYIYILNAGSKPETGLYLGSLKGEPPVMLVPRVTRGQVVRDHWLYYVRDEVLVKQKLDLSAKRVQGDAIPIADHVFTFSSTLNANFSADDSGNVIAYERPPAETNLVWRDRNGRETGRLQRINARKFRISPDGHRVAVEQFVADISNIWNYDLDRDIATPVTTNAYGVFAPLWSRDGQSLVVSYAFVETDPPSLSVLPLTTQPPKPLRGGDGVYYANDTMRDGGIIYTVNRHGQDDIELLQANGQRVPLEASKFNERDGAIAPDEQWLAFESDESGRPEIYVAPFHREGAKIRVSIDGGSEPRWSPDGRDLYYLAADGMLMHVPVPASGSVGRPLPLFRVSSARMMELEEMGVCHYDVAPDGRLLVRELASGSDDAPVAVIVSR